MRLVAAYCSLPTAYCSLMNSLQFLSHLIEQYGLYAVFFLVLIEGDVTLLLAGVLAHSGFFDDHSFAKVLLWGTLGGFASDNLAFAAGREGKVVARETAE